MRFVSLAPSCTEIVHALGCGDQLVGRTAFCDYPPEAMGVPALGGWISANVAAVVTLKPDLVLTSTFLQARIVAELRAQGITVCHTDPRTLGDVFSSFEMIASALGLPERGKELRARAEAELRPPAFITMPHAPKVYTEEWPDPPMASGNWVPDLIVLAGGQSLLRPGERSRVVSLEEVQAFDPDLIVLNYCGMAAVPTTTQIARFTNRPGWETLRAARADRIVALDDALLNRPGPRLAEGARQLLHALARGGSTLRQDPSTRLRQDFRMTA